MVLQNPPIIYTHPVLKIANVTDSELSQGRPVAVVWPAVGGGWQWGWRREVESLTWSWCCGRVSFLLQWPRSAGGVYVMPHTIVCHGQYTGRRWQAPRLAQTVFLLQHICAKMLCII